MFMDLIKEIKTKNADLKEAEIAGILYLIKTEKNLTNNSLVSLTGIPKNTLQNFKDSIKEYLDENDKTAISLNEKGRELLEKLNVKPYKWSLVDYASSEELEALGEKLKEIREKYKLMPAREYDQFFATVETSISKAKILLEKGLVKNKSVALIGDDDLVSVVLGLMSAGYERITVFDIDQNILDTLQRIYNDYNISNVELVRWDTRDFLEAKFISQYDVVMTDPPYTKPGVQLFLNRGIELLKPHKNYAGNYIFLCYADTLRNPEKVLEVQEVISHFNLVIEDRIHKFNRYDGAEAIGSVSSLYILKTTLATAAMDDYTTQNIYTFEDLKKTKFPFVSHYTYKVFEASYEKMRNEKILENLARKICSEHRLKIVDVVATEFDPKGFTLSLILKNSNLTIHTWPEFNALHIDLITCSPIYKAENLRNTVSKVFESPLVEEKRVE